MDIFWLVTGFIIIGILTYIKNSKAYDKSFYRNLNTSQLKAESRKLINEIISNFDNNSKFMYPENEGFEHLKCEAKKMILNIEKNNTTNLPSFTSNNINNDYFMSLATLNNWSKEKKDLIKNLNMVLTELEAKQQDL